jgi:hypothetical protein
VQELMKWKRKKTTHKYTRIDDFSLQLFDAIYENEFELAKILIDDGKVDVNNIYTVVSLYINLLISRWRVLPVRTIK